MTIGLTGPSRSHAEDARKELSFYGLPLVWLVWNKSGLNWPFWVAQVGELIGENWSATLWTNKTFPLEKEVPFQMDHIKPTRRAAEWRITKKGKY